MIAFSITKVGPLEYPGEPKVYLNNKDFERVLVSSDLQAGLIAEFGEGITIGSLGTEVDSNVFSEAQVQFNAPNTPIEGLGFYEKLNT